MSDWLPLILFILLGLFVLVAFEIRARRQNKATANEESAVSPTDTANDGECCGQHLVCERETLLQTNAEIIYYDDEELDALAGVEPQAYTEVQYQMIRQVFNTLAPKDVPGWVRSIQLRNIQLPPDIREEALLIVIERRHIK